MIVLAYLIKDSTQTVRWIRNEKLMSLFNEPKNISDIDKIVNSLDSAYMETQPDWQVILGELRFNNTICEGRLTSYLHFSPIGYKGTNADTYLSTIPDLQLKDLYGSNAGWIGPYTSTGAFRITTKDYKLENPSGIEVTVARLVNRTIPLYTGGDPEIIGCQKTDSGYQIIKASPSYSNRTLIKFTTYQATAEPAISCDQDNLAVEFYPANYYDSSSLVPKIVETVSSHFVSR